jgi:thioredoxin-related protein
MNDPRTEEVKEILLDDGQEENIEFARKYKITATPTLIVVENEEKIEEYVGGVPITQNIVKLLDKYSDQLGDTL